MGATNIDELMIRLKAQGENAVISMMDKVESSVHHLVDRVVSMANPINMLMAAVAGGGLLAFGAEAINAAAQVDRLHRTLDAVSGSAERAEQIWQFVEKLQKPSIFTLEPLAQAAEQLESFGLKTEEWLPVIEKLATIRGEPGAIEELVMLLGRAKGGDVSEVLGTGRESLGRFGLPHELWVKMGLNFDEKGQYVGSVNEALNAIGQAVQEKFGRVGALLKDSPMAKWTTYLAEFHRLLVQVGNVLIAHLLPVLERVTDVVARLEASGVVGRIVDQFMRLLHIDVLQDMIPKVVALLITALEEIPPAAERIFNWLDDRFANLRQTLSMIAGIMAGMWAAGAVYRFAIAMKEVLALLKSMSIVETIIAAVRSMSLAPLAIAAPAGIGAAALVYNLGSGNINVPALGNETEKIKKEFADRYNAVQTAIYGSNTGQMLDALTNLANKTALSGADAFAWHGTDAGSVASIAHNTARTARATEGAVDALRGMRAEAFGGGERTRSRVSSIEVEFSLARALSLGIG